MGPTTGITTGRVRAIELDHIVVTYLSLGNCAFDDQVEIEGVANLPIGEGGDSGSVILDSNGNILALLFAGMKTAGRTGTA